MWREASPLLENGIICQLCNEFTVRRFAAGSIIALNIGKINRCGSCIFRKYGRSHLRPGLRGGAARGRSPVILYEGLKGLDIGVSDGGDPGSTGAGRGSAPGRTVRKSPGGSGRWGMGVLYEITSAVRTGPWRARAPSGGGSGFSRPARLCRRGCGASASGAGAFACPAGGVLRRRWRAGRRG